MPDLPQFRYLSTIIAASFEYLFGLQEEQRYHDLSEIILIIINIFSKYCQKSKFQEKLSKNQDFKNKFQKIKIS